MIDVQSGSYDRTACLSHIELTANTLLSQTAVSSYQWEVTDLNPSGTQTVPLSQTSCGTGTSVVYSGSSNRTQTGANFSLDIPMLNAFFVSLTVTDTSGRTAKTTALFGASYLDKDLNDIQQISATYIINPHVKVQIQDNTISFINTGKVIGDISPINGSEIDMFSNFDGHIADWNNDSNWTTYLSGSTPLSYSYLSSGDHSGQYTVDSQDPGIAGFFTPIATRYIYITQ
jgi:hypothetical protein